MPRPMKPRSRKAKPDPTTRISEIASELWERDEIHAALGRLGQVFDQAVTNRVAGLIDRMGNIVDRAASGPRPTPNTPPQSSRSRAEIDPHVVLGFGVDEPLTVEKVQTRRKELAKVFHPDKQGGNTDAMRRVNIAAEVLLTRLKQQSS